MTWIKLDDRAPRHPKIAGLSDRAFRWWVLGLCYASEFLTDGVLPAAFLRTVPTAVRRELEDARLWAWVLGDVVRIHGYLEHQTARDAVERERQRNRDRRRGRTAGTPGGTPGGRTAGKPRPEIREQRSVQEPPIPPSGEGGKPTRAELKKAAEIIRAYGHCPHHDEGDPVCRSHEECMGRIVGRLRAALAAGLRAEGAA